MVRVGRQLSVLLVAAWALQTAAQPIGAPAINQSDEAARTAVTAQPTGDGPNKTHLYMASVAVSAQSDDDEQFRTFYIKDDLSLGITYGYRLKFDLSAQTLRREPRPVPDGWYQLTIASFLKHLGKTDDPRVTRKTLSERFVTRSDVQTVYITNGRGKAEFTLSFDNPTDAATLNTLYVEFIPLELKCGTTEKPKSCLEFRDDGRIDDTKSTLRAREDYYPHLMNLDFLPYARRNSGEAQDKLSQFSRDLMRSGLFRYTQRVIAERVEAGLLKTPKHMTAAAYAAKQELNVLSINDSALNSADSRWLGKWRISDVIRAIFDARGGQPIKSREYVKALDRTFCTLINQRTRRFERHVNPASPTVSSVGADGFDRPIWDCGDVSIRYARVQHVGQVMTPSPWRGRVDIRKYAVTRNFSVGRSQDMATAWTTTGKPFAPFKTLTGAISLRAADAFSWLELAHTITYSTTRTRNQSGSSSDQEYMDLTPQQLTFTADDVRTCLEVRIERRFKAPFDERTHLRKGFYVCDQSRDNVSIRELYMHAFTRMGETPQADPNERIAQRVNLSIRGDRDVSAFYYLTNEGIDAGGDRADWDPKLAEDHFRDTPFAQSGVVVTPVIAPQKGFPSYGDLLFHLQPASGEVNPQPRR